MTPFEKIRFIRQLSKQTQEEFGNNLGISKGTVSNLEKEKVPLPPYVVILLKLLYNVDPEWLLDDSQSDFDKRFYEKEGSADDAVTPLLIGQLRELKNPYKDLVVKTIQEFYAAQKKQEELFDIDLLISDPNDPDNTNKGLLIQKIKKTNDN